MNTVFDKIMTAATVAIPVIAVVAATASMKSLLSGLVIGAFALIVCMLLRAIGQLTIILIEAKKNLKESGEGK